ncbi:MAG: helix-turn-helix domain-containing protein [Xanthobacteraceae bacterium]
MTGADFRAWRLRCGLTVPAAAKLLGVSRRTIFNLQKSFEVPLTTAIAADAVEIEINHRKKVA